MKLSLCIATFNEEKNIHYPLDSAYDLADDVVIVDGRSTDKTIEKAKSYGEKIRVIIADNPAMFHKNKQKAIEAAKGEWILQLDADEALSDELKVEIKRLIHRNNQSSMINNQKSSKPQNTKKQNKIGGWKLNIDNLATPVAYWVPRKNWFLSRFLLKGGLYPDYTIRLYRNGYARFPCKDVHENVEIIQENNNLLSVSNNQIKDKIQKSNSKKEVGRWELSVEYLKSPILHYADPTFSRYLTRWNRYTTLDADLLSKKTQYPISNSQYFIMAIDYFVFKPTVWFFSTYFRHLGFLDGFPGFVFSLFSSLRFWVIYIKYASKQES